MITQTVLSDKEMKSVSSELNKTQPNGFKHARWEKRMRDYSTRLDVRILNGGTVVVESVIRVR